jgi:ribose-phosphate pyrophosphokinase
MRLALIAGSANPGLAAAVARRVGVELDAVTIDRFPDGELGVSVGSLRGADVYVLQSTGPPAHDHLVELALLADAVRRSGAARITGVIPYLAYARQDRREQEGQGIGARVVAELISGLFDRVVAVDLHTSAVEGFFGCPVEQLSAVPLLAAHVRSSMTDHVVVAPDLGAVKRAERYARMLGLRTAVVRKRRLSGREVEATAVEGDVRDRPVLIVDDIVSTGATIEAAVRALRGAGALQATVVATHGLLVPPADERLTRLGLAAIILTDTVPPPAWGGAGTVVSVADLLADAVGRLHRDEPLADLVRRG